MRTLTLAAALAATCAVIHADFSYQESSQMTGGTMLTVLKLGGPFTRGARGPQISTVAVRGNRMLRSDKDSTSIIDLDKETITDIDISKKTYSVTTFAQIRAAMEKAMAELRKRDKSADPNMKFKVTANSTGQTKDIRGLTAKELLIGMEMQATDTKSGQTGTFNIANDAYLATVGGYDEVKAFELKLAQKLASTFRPGLEQMAMTNPNMVQGMAEAAEELAKVDGVPIQSIVRMGNGSAEALHAAGQKSDSQEKGDAKGKSAAATAGAIAGRLGGIGGFGRRNNKAEEKAPADDGKQSAPAATILMEMTTDLSEFSTAGLAEAKFQVPAGFKEVQSEIAKRAK